MLKVSAQTVMRDWKIARAWLARELLVLIEHVAGIAPKFDC